MKRSHRDDCDSFHLSRRKFLNLTASGLFGSFLAQGSQQPISTGKRPNIVFILADDLGYGDLGCYGGPVSTPNIDQLAQHGGLRFTNFHSGGPVCSASRATLMTGRYAQRLGVPELNSVIIPETESGLLGEVTLADVLRYNGYQTGCVGKWHLGHRRPEFMPISHGFNFFKGIPYSNNLSPLPYYWGDEIVGDFDEKTEMLNERFTLDALEFINWAQAQPDPFFLYLAYTEPHVPLKPSAPFLGSSGFGVYYDVVLELDASVGRILRSLGENTLVFFTSDNGADINPDISKEEQGSNGILKEGKYSVCEGGIRVPFISFMPECLPSGVCHELTSAMDIAPTLGILSGFQPDDPHLEHFDGINIWPLMTGEVERINRRCPLLYFRLQYPECASGRYTDPADLKEYNVKIRYAEWDYPYSKPELYNMDVDPAEKNNIASEHPDIVAQMLWDVKKELVTFPSNTINSGII